MSNKTRITLIESESKTPKIEVQVAEGKQVRVEKVELLRKSESGEPKAISAALCGYSNACVALIETSDELRDPRDQ